MATRLRFILGAATHPVNATILRTPTLISLSSSLSLLHLTPKPHFPKTLHYRHYNVSATVLSETAIETPSTTSQDLENHQNHPWPEWVTFVDQLKSRGYFPQSSSFNGGDASDLAYRDMKVLKDPCLSFARDRFDIFGSLPKGDIQIIVEAGCPKLLRKVVNSAKRLRLYVGLDEKNVCSRCGLRGSCDRAYVMLKESEGDAQTVDLMRLLLFYALDPLVISGAERRPGIEQAESSARRLLSMFVDLSEASPAVASVKPSKTASSQKKNLVKPLNSELSPNIEGLRGPWRCPKCNFVDFVGNLRCKCSNEDSTIKVKAGPPDVEINQNDWSCPKCNFMNFSRNVRCLKCKTEGPKRQRGEAHNAAMKRGDWNCPECGCMNFASRRDCFRCKDPRPSGILKSGEWECPKCDYLNFRRNSTCLKCGSEPSKEGVVQYEEQIWRRPQ